MQPTSPVRRGRRARYSGRVPVNCSSTNRTIAEHTVADLTLSGRPVHYVVECYALYSSGHWVIETHNNGVMDSSSLRCNYHSRFAALC
jgi:hypothetical protein